MLVVNKNSNNTFILTLNEKQTLASPYFLMRCVSDYNRTEKAFVLATDLSSYTTRYNQFLFTESTTEVLTSGTATLNPSGWWTYYVYEQTSSSNTNYLLASNTVPLEIGRIWVNFTEENIIKHAQTTQFKGYGNGQV